MSAQQAQATTALPTKISKQHIQQSFSSFGHVAAWLSTSHSTLNTNSCPQSLDGLQYLSGSGPPLITRFSRSLLWYFGLSGMLSQQPRMSHTSPMQHYHTTAAAQAAASSGTASKAAQRVPSGSQQCSVGIGSHPLTLQQIEQSMDFSTSSTSAGPGFAPVQAISKGDAAEPQLYTCSSMALQ